jgi:hypothetical protein
MWEPRSLGLESKTPVLASFITILTIGQLSRANEESAKPSGSTLNFD